MQFKARIEINGVNPYVLVSSSRAHELKPDWRKPMPVLIRVNGAPKDYWHINMMPKGNGDFYLYLHNDVRKASSTKVGDVVNVEVLFDDSYKNGPQHESFELLDKLLSTDSAARTNWLNLSPSRQKEVLRYFANLKSNDAVERNFKRLSIALRGDSTHFMGRDWVDGK